ncbi:MAG TPA: GNAT family N-acetyltransferase [Trebonia sp.]|nr:GNAT family N-acetyltransferase [Trebonia sp.]
MANQFHGSSVHGSSASSRESIVLREARREDVPEIVALLADDVLGAGREGPVDDAYFAAFEQIEADPSSRLLVAERDGRVAGTLQLTMVPGLSRHGMLRGQIEAVRVAADQRGQRLGRRMIEWAIEVARGQGCGLLQLTSDKQRPDAIRFYESLGFTASHEGLKLPLDRVLESPPGSGWSVRSAWREGPRRRRPWSGHGGSRPTLHTARTK